MPIRLTQALLKIGIADQHKRVTKSAQDYTSPNIPDEPVLTGYS